MINSLLQFVKRVIPVQKVCQNNNNNNNKNEMNEMNRRQNKNYEILMGDVFSLLKNGTRKKWH